MSAHAAACIAWGFVAWCLLGPAWIALCVVTRAVDRWLAVRALHRDLAAWGELPVREKGVVRR